MLKINEKLDTEPELINSSPLSEGWIYKATVNDPDDVGMSESDYNDFIA